ncbi:MAG: hypothetical protein KDA24_13385 [Deltaproteobacteria bacterium]|nr:hypothetical protein [Deltaproteobacteria bacterium]
MRPLILSLLLVLVACSGPVDDDDSAPLPANDDDDDTTVADDDDTTVADDDDSAPADDDDATTPLPPGLPTWTDAPCDSMAGNTSGSFQGIVDTWADQVDAVPFEGGRTVFAGSSSIRLWERLLEDFSAWSPLQRGFGGSRLWDVAEHSAQLVTRHDPSAVVLFAGTNDIAAGLSPDTVMLGYRCLVERISDDLGDVPIAFIAITPTPSRWASWDDANAVNNAVAELADAWRDLHFLDTRDAFLATGAPPDASLFQGDGLHLSPAGYALWAALIGPQLAALAEPITPPLGSFATGSRLLIDLGPSNPEDGTPTASPDGFGQHWNNWHPMDGESSMFPGEQLGDLVDDAGTATGLRLVLSSSMTSNGILNGGLLNPSDATLGDLAVGTATQDYVWRNADTPGSLAIEGLDPTGSYTVRLFASRNASESRVTRYSVSGASGRSTVDLAVSGSGIGDGAQPDGNVDGVAELAAQTPDAYGRLHIDYAGIAGSYTYLGILELVRE